MDQLHSALWRDSEVDSLFSPDAEIAAMLKFETELAAAQARASVISHEAAEAIRLVCTSFMVDMPQLRKGIQYDGMAVPELVRQLRMALAAEHREALHLRSTSQDVIDTVLILQSSKAIGIIEHRMNAVSLELQRLAAAYGNVPQMGRTRMQRALPLTAGHRVEAWRAPLQRLAARLAELKPRLLVIQCGGPIGIDAGSWNAYLAAGLGLGVPSRSWHSARDVLGELASWLSLLTGTLGKVAIDVAMMAQNEVGEVALSGGGSSSAMHHKSNPVGAELIVAMARCNAGMLGCFHQALVHEQERSGAGWALEWMILPEMISMSGASLDRCRALLSSLTLKPGAIVH